MEKSQIHFFNFFNFNLTETKLKNGTRLSQSESRRSEWRAIDKVQNFPTAKKYFRNKKNCMFEKWPKKMKVAKNVRESQLPKQKPSVKFPIANHLQSPHFLGTWICKAWSMISSSCMISSGIIPAKVLLKFRTSFILSLKNIKMSLFWCRITSIRQVIMTISFCERTKSVKPNENFGEKH